MLYVSVTRETNSCVQTPSIEKRTTQYISLFISVYIIYRFIVFIWNFVKYQNYSELQKLFQKT